MLFYNPGLFYNLATMLKVTVIGSGNVAQHLIRVFNNSPEIEMVQAYARTPQSLLHILPENKITDNFNNLKDADIYIISVTDDAISGVASALPFSGRLVVHTSGSVSQNSLDSKNKRGVFYPLQTFSKNKEVDFKKVPLCLESEYLGDYRILEKLANTIAKNVYPVDSTQRQSLHIAAVFVSNFVNHMYKLGNDICQTHNLPFDILKPLITETAAKVQLLTPAEAQTGPARRNDQTIIQKHIDFLEDKNMKGIYNILSKSIQNTNE